MSPRARVLLVASVLLATLAVLVRWGEAERSHTADEPMHLVRGVAYWQQPDTTLSYSHPPLGNALVTWPVRSDRVDVTTLRGWKEKDPVEVGHAYFQRDFEAARAELSRARDAMAVVAVAFALFVFGWCWRRWDAATALVALALFVGSPTILAHAGLVTTDLPAAFAGFVALTQLVAWLESRGRVRLVLFGLATGVLLATKHSGAPMFAFMAALALACAWAGRLRFAGSTRVRRVGRALGELALVGVTAVLVVNATYRFDRTGMTVDEIVAQPEPRNWIATEYDGDLLHAPAFVPGDLPMPLPYAYVYGLSTISHQAELGHRGWFFGVSSRRNPLYFPVMTILKQPIGILVLLGVAAWCVRRRVVVPTASTWLVIAWCLAFVALASSSRINIGVRHVLPIFPVMIVLAARAAVIAWRTDRRWARPLVAGCIASTLCAGALAVPHTLGWFNLLVGGPAGGNRIAVIGEDWGQDSTALALWLRAHEHDTVHYFTRGRPLRPLELRRFGIATKPLQCDAALTDGSIIAVHRAELVRTPGCFAWLDACTPLTTIDHHIHVYRCGDA